MFNKIATKRGAGSLDDRGEALRFKPEGDPSGKRWLLSVMTYLTLAFAATLIFGLITGPSAASHPLRDVIILVVLLALVTLYARTKSSQMAAVSEHLTALRMCGACGGDLRTADVHPDGCVLCPECGAAWRSDRFGAVDLAALDPATLRSLIKKGYLAKRSQMTTDKLGGHLEVALKTPLHWLGSGRAPAVVDARFLKYSPGKVHGIILKVGLAVTLLGLAYVSRGFIFDYIVHQNRSSATGGVLVLLVTNWFMVMLSGQFSLRMPIVRIMPGSNAGQPLAEVSVAANG
ncbi:MAG: hypothetical protein KF864_05735 [Phycisphaeraceae bacterium]|nr:hypothetical protein [Phycisphaeraceae bacterium]